MSINSHLQASPAVLRVGHSGMLMEGLTSIPPQGGGVLRPTQQTGRRSGQSTAAAQRRWGSEPRRRTWTLSSLGGALWRSPAPPWAPPSPLHSAVEPRSNQPIPTVTPGLRASALLFCSPGCRGLLPWGPSRGVLGLAGSWTRRGQAARAPWSWPERCPPTP